LGLVLAGLVLAGLGAWVGGRHLWARHHLRAAESALESYHPAEALEHLRACLRVWPRDVHTRLLAARAARQAGDFDEAQQHLEEFDQLARDLPDEEAAEGTLEWALLRVQNGDLERDEFLLKAVEKNHPQWALIVEALTEGYLRMYRVVEASACLHLWLSRQPDNVRALLLRGQVCQRLHDYKAAAENYRRVVRLVPGHDDARLRLANALLEAGQNREALRHLEQLRRRQPDNSEVLVRLGYGLNNLGRSARARQFLDRVLAREPHNTAALIGRGQLALQVSRVGEAEGFLRRAVAASPHDRKAHFLLYKCLEQAGKTTEAAAEKRQWKRLEASMVRIIEIGNRLMPLKPNDPALHCELGTILLRIGQEELGVRWLHSALQCDARWKPAHAALADYYRRHGDAKRAAGHAALQ
jgi:predicted Zn-dependent protease